MKEVVTVFVLADQETVVVETLRWAGPAGREEREGRGRTCWPRWTSLPACWRLLAGIVESGGRSEGGEAGGVVGGESVREAGGSRWVTTSCKGAELRVSVGSGQLPPVCSKGPGRRREGAEGREGRAERAGRERAGGVEGGSHARVCPYSGTSLSALTDCSPPAGAQYPRLSASSISS